MVRQRTTLRKRSFRKEFSRQLKMGIAAAVGFSIAYAWREPLLLFGNTVIAQFFTATLSLQLSILVALFITFLGVLVLWITSRILK